MPWAYRGHMCLCLLNDLMPGKQNCEYCYLNGSGINPLYQRVMAHGLVLETLALDTKIVPSEKSVHPCRQNEFYFVYKNDYCSQWYFLMLPEQFLLRTSKMLYKLCEFSFKTCSALLSISSCPPLPYFCMWLWKLGHELQIVNLTVHCLQLERTANC